MLFFLGFWITSCSYKKVTPFLLFFNIWKHKCHIVRPDLSYSLQHVPLYFDTVSCSCHCFVFHSLASPGFIKLEYTQLCTGMHVLKLWNGQHLTVNTYQFLIWAFLLFISRQCVNTYEFSFNSSIQISGFGQIENRDQYE